MAGLGLGSGLGVGLGLGPITALVTGLTAMGVGQAYELVTEPRHAVDAEGIAELVVELVVGLVAGLSFGLVAGLSFGLIAELTVTLVVALGVALLVKRTYTLMQPTIDPVEQLDWAWPGLRSG